MFDLHSLEDCFEFSFSDFPCFNERYTCLNGEGADNNKRYAIIERLPIVIHHESQTDEQESSSACSTEDGKQSFGDDFLQSFGLAGGAHLRPVLLMELPPPESVGPWMVAAPKEY